jgi:integrase
MNLSVTVWFDERAGHYRARFRAPGFDKKVKPPRRLFEDRGVSPEKPSRLAETIAQQWALDEKRRMEGRPLVGISTPVQPLAEIFELYVRRNPDGIQPVTVVKHRQVLANLLSFEAFRTLPPGEIDDGAVLDYLNEREKAGAASSTILTEVRLLFALLRRAREWSRDTGVTSIAVTEPPKRLRDAVRMRPSKGLAIPFAQFMAMLEVPMPKVRQLNRFRRVMIVGATTMLRRENLTALRWSWIDRKNRWLHIPVEHVKGRLAQRRPISVPLCDWALEAIGSPKVRSEFVFADRDGGRAYRFDNMMAFAAKIAGLPHITLHDLRRTGATWLAEAGVDERVIAALLGHAAQQNALRQRLMLGNGVTRGKYLYVSDESLREGVATFDRLRADFLTAKRENFAQDSPPTQPELAPAE